MATEDTPASTESADGTTGAAQTDNYQQSPPSDKIINSTEAKGENGNSTPFATVSTVSNKILTAEDMATGEVDAWVSAKEDLVAVNFDSEEITATLMLEKEPACELVEHLQKVISKVDGGGESK